MPASTLSSSQRTHRHSTAGRSTCKVGRCTFSGTRPQVIKHEVQEHLLRRFFCCACDKTLSSFESLRTHANSQHFRNRLFKCETCHTTYLDPARLAKCRKRHRGQFRCPELGCVYHNARKNSVVRHMKTQHHRVADEDEIPFDNMLSSAEPPKMRRVGSSSASLVSSLPGAVESLLGIPSQGPSDDELFRLSEDKRRVTMELTRKEHVQWMGGEDALRAAVPDYPVWTQRDHPYGRPPSPEPEPSKNDDDTDSSSLPTSPELVVSSPEQVNTLHVPSSTTLRAWAPQASPVMTTAPASSGLLVPSNNLLMPASTPRTALSTATSSTWFSGGDSYSDAILPGLTITQRLLLPSPSLTADPFNVPALESSTLFSPNPSSSPLPSPPQAWQSPVTPQRDNFTSTLYEHSSNSIYGSQYSDDSSASSQDSLFLTSPNPTFGYFGAPAVQAHLIQDVKSECGGHVFFPEWVANGES